MGSKHRDCNVLLFSVFIILLFPLKNSSSIYNITQSQPLLQGQKLVSDNQVFELSFFSLNNSEKQYLGVWYKQTSPPRIVWIANREKPLTVYQNSSASLRIGANGDLQLIEGNTSSLIWSANVSVFSSNDSIAVLLDSGNFVIKDGLLGDNLWESFNHPVDTLLPGGKLGFNVKTGEKYVLTSWKLSGIDPSTGDFVIGIADRKPPEAYIWINETVPLWRSGPWDKSRFTGIPYMYANYDSMFDIVEDKGSGTTYLYYNSYGSSYLYQMSITSSGVLQILVKVEGKDWLLNWEAPANKCDTYGFCGPFGFCNTLESRICECLKGFVPKSNDEWSRGNWTNGCMRRKELACQRNTSRADSRNGERDGFKKLSNMKIPDFYEYVITDKDDVESCKLWCLNNCSCLAFSFVNGIGCLVWSKDLVDIQEFPSGGNNVYIRLALSELVDGQHVKKIIISISVISGVLIITLLYFGLLKWRTKRKGNVTTTQKFDNESGDTLQFTNQQDPPELPIFDFGTILVATDNFNVKNKLGQGGFGSVYKGKLPDGKEVAVKRLSSSSGQGIQEFKNEILLISKLQHRNLVRLFGCCFEKEEKILIYELMPNKSLDFFIFDTKRRIELTWATRFNIILGIARGLLYLHRDSCLRVIHRDLKVSNILLDENMNPKISDFGLARIFQGTLDHANTHRVVGTIGYMSPEYAMNGMFSEKSDVFSFGVLLLEIVSGRKNTNFHSLDEHPSLIFYAWHLWSEDRAIELVDETLIESCFSAEVLRCIHVGILCVQDRVGDRPSMPDVVFMLSNETDRPQPKQPVLTFERSCQSETRSQNENKYSVNQADTVSLIEGR